MRLTGFANAALLVKPPELKASKIPILVVFDSQDAVGVE
jgi:hypothetical protein